MKNKKHTKSISLHLLYSFRSCLRSHLDLRYSKKNKNIVNWVHIKLLPSEISAAEVKSHRFGARDRHWKKEILKHIDYRVAAAVWNRISFSGEPWRERTSERLCFHRKLHGNKMGGKKVEENQQELRGKRFSRYCEIQDGVASFSVSLLRREKLREDFASTV